MVARHHPEMKAAGSLGCRCRVVTTASADDWEIVNLLSVLAACYGTSGSAMPRSRSSFSTAHHGSMAIITSCLRPEGHLRSRPLHRVGFPVDDLTTRYSTKTEMTEHYVTLKVGLADGCNGYITTEPKAVGLCRRKSRTSRGITGPLSNGF